MVGASAMFGRNQIDPARVKRMTAPDAPEGKPTTAQEPVFTNGFNGIVGAGGIKPAISTQPHPQGHLIQANQPDPY